MTRIKKGLSILLIALLIVSMMPAAVFGVQKPNADEVIYNLGSQEITVGNDSKKAENSPWNYKLFNEDGSYTIQLEDNAFFPYEVQFKVGDNTFVEWFETPESTVQIGSHTFRVHTEQNDPNQLSQIGVWVGGEYIAARPTPKTFTNSQFMPMSLLPLDEVKLELSLTDYTMAELKMAKLSTLSSELKNSENSSVVWVKKPYSFNSTDDGYVIGDGEYEIADFDEYIDLRPTKYYSYEIIRDTTENTTLFMELIVGDGNQLNPLNKRYFINIDIATDLMWLDFELYKQNSTEPEQRTKIDVDYVNVRPSFFADSTFVYIVSSNDVERGQGEDEIFVGLNWAESFAKAKEGFEVEVYKGIYTDLAELSNVSSINKITSQIWAQNMADKGSGYRLESNVYYDQEFTAVIKSGEDIIGIAPFIIELDTYPDGVYLGGVYKNAIDTDTIAFSDGLSLSLSDDVQLLTIYIYDENAIDDAYYLRLRYDYRNFFSRSYADPDFSNYSDNVYVEKAVLGHYDNIEDIYDNMEDISSQLFPEFNNGGYLAKYSGEGQDFTIIDVFGKVHKFTVKAETVPTPRDSNGVVMGNLYKTDTGISDALGYFWYNNWGMDITYSIYDTNPVDGVYYLRMMYKLGHLGGSYSNNVYVKRAVLGHYENVDEIIAQPDISSQLFPNSNTGGYPADYSGEGQQFTVLDKFGEIHQFTVRTESAPRGYIFYFDGIYKTDTRNEPLRYNHVRSRTNGVETHTFMVYDMNPVDGEYYLRLGWYDKIGLEKAVHGDCNSIDELNDKPDIKEELFSKADKGGYRANYSGVGQTFTLLDSFGNTYKFIVRLASESDISQDDPYFRVDGASDLSNVYVLPSKHDSYYDMGYQTILYTDDISPTEIKPTFWNEPGTTVYAGSTGSYGAPQISGESERDFSNGPVQYAVSAANGEGLKNYWVTFIPKQEGAKLFVNGVNGPDGPKREVFLTSINNNTHDIFIANVGDQELTGLNATLSDDAVNVRLDPYWTVGGTNNDRLAAFENTELTSERGELQNVAKIRLLPDGEGEIKGKLTISADDQDPIEITLTGNAGDPKLTTASIPKAVKYVPYAIQILHNNKYPWNVVTMDIISGSLPKGLTLKANGELYGVPLETGTFTFEVQMINSDTRFGNSTAYYTLIVAENTNENVKNATDIGYEISKPIGKVINGENVVNTIADHEFITKGDLTEFIDLWLNGEKLIVDEDYTKEEGSTKITIKSKTFQNKVNKTGTNTIVAEFRVDGDDNKELKRAAQNFKMNLGGGSGSSGGSSGGGFSGSGGSSDGYVQDESITISDNIVIVELTQGLTRLSSTQINLLINANKIRPVEIRGNGYTIIFPTGSMKEIPGQTEYDFGLALIEPSNNRENSQAQALLTLAGESGVLALHFNHSGPLPGEATIRVSVGTQFSGQTLYYYYYNVDKDGLEYRQSAIVDDEGSVSVVQDHCSYYLLSSSNLDSVSEYRTSGDNRYLTAIKIADTYFPDGASTVVLTRGDSSADAIIAVPLTKHYNAPLLLTPSSTLPEPVLAQIKNLKADKVLIVGGPEVISHGIAQTLINTGLQVERIYGQNRYETAREVALHLAAQTNTEIQSAVLVNGDSYADALSISAWAGYRGIPILYADGHSNILPEATAQTISELNISRTILIGGDAVLPVELEKNLPNPLRYSGDDRYGTNATILNDLQPDSTKIFVATGKDFADALVAAAIAARDNSWLVLTGASGHSTEAKNQLSAQQQQLLSSRHGIVEEFQVFGGIRVVPDPTLNTIKELIGK